MSNNPAHLVAILVAARRSGDRDLERMARRLLRERHGVTIRFAAEGQRCGQHHQERRADGS